MAIGKRSELCDSLCKMVRCSRKNPGQETLSLRELRILHSAIHLTRERLEDAEGSMEKINEDDNGDEDEK